MTIPELRFEPDADCLVASIAGVCNAEQMLRFIEDIAAAARAEGTRAVLMDGRHLTLPTGDLDRYAFASMLGRVWTTIPLAVVGSATFVDPKRFGEGVARTRGVNVRVFTDVEAARSWLQKVTPPRP